MDVTPTAEFQRSLENFRHLLFHLQMECGSVHHIFRFFREEKSMEHFDALKELDPDLMSQLLAREYVLEARRADSPDNARRHLETALQLDPKCPEACMELAALSDSPEAAMMWYQRSIDANISLHGQERMDELLEQFKQKPWQQVETHSYFKAKVCLAEKLFRHEYYDVAALHFRELLQLNSSDELKLRHYLMVCYLCNNQLKEAEALNGEYRGDCSVSWYYCRAFYQYKREGDTRKTRRALHRAFRRNLWVPLYLLGMEELPYISKTQKMNPDIKGTKPEGVASGFYPVEQAFKEGGRKEAVDCVQCVAPAFCEDSQLVYWVWEMLKSIV